VKKQEERDAVREQMEVALFDRIDKLYKQLEEGVRDLRQSKDLCEEYSRRLRERRLEREGASARIQERGTIARIKYRERRTVEANLRRAVNELIEKLKKKPTCTIGKLRLPFMDKSGTSIESFKTRTITRRKWKPPSVAKSRNWRK
jgi:hypothetical protein